MNHSITPHHGNQRRRIWFSLMLATGLLSTFICASANDEVDLQHAPNECPHYLDLNPTTFYYLTREGSSRMGYEQIAFESDQYSNSRLGAGLLARYQPDEYRLLETARDRDACIALNETYYTHRSGMYASVDRSTGRRVPERYAMYYKVPGRYVVLYAPYSPGSPNRDEIGPPSFGCIFVSVYDDQDFKELGGFTM
ncbi:MAG: hypothetical protein ACPGJE_05325 [Wenzhouxiangellaceae bacterium]